MAKLSALTPNHATWAYAYPKPNQTSILAKATRAMLDNTASANTINKLFSQLIYGAEQWLPYSHPSKIHQLGPKGTFTTSTTQLPTEQVWKDLIYAHYSLHPSTPLLAVRAELGSFPTYIPGICRVSNYMTYLCGPECPPCKICVLPYYIIYASLTYITARK